MPQRALAARTGLNLAKVNFVLKRLKEKGYIKLQRVRDNPHKRRYLYLLTPEGLAAKSRLAYGFLRRTLATYARLEQRVLSRVRELEDSGARRVILWGQTEITGMCLRLLSQHNVRLQVLGVVEGNGNGSAGLVAASDAVLVCDPEADVASLPESARVWRLV
jgi:DNA-binding MarR family transcriptional regulator